MYDRHDEEWETIKSGYSSRANIDSEYLEDYIIETVDDAYRIEGKDRYYADVEYEELKIDFKGISNTKKGKELQERFGSINGNSASGMPKRA